MCVTSYLLLFVPYIHYGNCQAWVWQATFQAVCSSLPSLHYGWEYTQFVCCFSGLLSESNLEEGARQRSLRFGSHLCWGSPFLLLTLPDLVLTLWGWRHVLKKFPPPQERAQRSRCLPLMRRVARASIETRLWICHHSLSCLRSCGDKSGG